VGSSCYLQNWFTLLSVGSVFGGVFGMPRIPTRLTDLSPWFEKLGIGGFAPFLKKHLMLEQFAEIAEDDYSYPFDR
jgi:hypothetical protein